MNFSAADPSSLLCVRDRPGARLIMIYHCSLSRFITSAADLDFSRCDCVSPSQGEIGEPGQKGSKGDKGEHVSRFGNKTKKN